MILGVNASRARSGGAKAHLVGLLSELDPSNYGFSKVHVWSYSELLESLPDRPWLVSHCPAATQMSILQQLAWERFQLPKELRAKGCDILFNVDAGTICHFHPNVTMSRDMLSYEPGEIERYGLSKARLRLIVLRWVQNASLRSADGTIFLTKYASQIIQGFCGPCNRVTLVPHGVGESFRTVEPLKNWPLKKERPIECLYVSNTAPYKHQWHVVRALELLKKKGYLLRLTLVGGGKGPAQARLLAQIKVCDPIGEFVRQVPFVPQGELPEYFSRADLFVFASSCENMPNTLIEAMAAGLPIACSDRGPMPEVLQDAGCYFDPENPASIATAIEKLILNESFRLNCAAKAKELAKAFSWKRTAEETFTFIGQVLNSK
jgi:glycosyltransferase involved in cell wall biosynthesis